MQQLGTDIWTIDFPFSVGNLALGSRTTIVRTDSGLWVHAPGPEMSEIDALGPVTSLVSPNSMHYLFLAEAQKKYPEAKTYITHALQRKIEIPHEAKLSDTPPDHWGGALESVAIGGASKLGEVAFYHRASKTLILTDLVFNLQRSPSAFTRFFMKLNGAYGHLGPSRLFRYMLVDDRKQLADSVKRILQWDFEKLVMAHGEIVRSNARDQFARAFSWLTT